MGENEDSSRTSVQAATTDEDMLQKRSGESGAAESGGLSLLDLLSSAALSLLQPLSFSAHPASDMWLARKRLADEPYSAVPSAYLVAIVMSMPSIECHISCRAVIALIETP